MISPLTGEFTALSHPCDRSISTSMYKTFLAHDYRCRPLGVWPPWMEEMQKDCREQSLPWSGGLKSHPCDFCATHQNKLSKTLTGGVKNKRLTTVVSKYRSVYSDPNYFKMSHSSIAHEWLLHTYSVEKLDNLKMLTTAKRQLLRDCHPFIVCKQTRGSIWIFQDFHESPHI